MRNRLGLKGKPLVCSVMVRLTDTMPLEIELRPARGSRLGMITEVQRAIAAALPGTRFYKEPSGSEKIRIARDQGIEFPPIAREHLEKTEESYRGDYESDGFSLEFWFGSSECVDQIHVDARGTGDAPKALRRIVARTDWRAICLATGAELTEADWSGFKAWRDKSIKRIRGDPGAAPNGAPPPSDNSRVTEGRHR